MFKRNYQLKNGKKLEIVRCSDAEVPYIKNLKNIMDAEVQSIAHIGTYKSTKVYLFKKLMNEDEYSYEKTRIGDGLSSARTVFLLAVIDNEIAGYINSSGLWKNENDIARKNLLLFDVEVISRFGNLNIASLLINALRECGAENGYENIYSGSEHNSSLINDNSAAMINLFIKTGAEELNFDASLAVLFGEDYAYESIWNATNNNHDNDYCDSQNVKSYRWITHTSQKR